MAPGAFRTPSGSMPAVAADGRDDGMMPAFDNQEHRSSSSSKGMWERRRRRLDKKKSSSSRDFREEDDNNDEPDKDLGEMKRNRRRSASSKPKREKREREVIEDEEMDPYDSDPGESYRQHCLRVNGIGTKTCLPVPGFLKIKGRSTTGEGETVLTAPPSPMQSEMGDPFGHTPASLPPNVNRVRYSLRSSVTDGSEKQPMGPSVMERRELRPNNVHINVSHWSDPGGRPYMEDRYVLTTNFRA